MTDSFSVKRKLVGIAGAFISLAIPFFIAEFETEHDIKSNQSLCPFKLLSGLPCPGCGITKSLVYIYKGDLLQSLSYHLFGPASFVFCLMIILLFTIEIINQKEYFKDWFYSKKLTIVLGISLGSYHLIRLFFFLRTHNFEEILKESIWL
jgi:hypothetical protein